MSPTFHDQLIAMLPKLRVQALVLTQNPSQADDLVQDSVCNALAGQSSFTEGTNFQAWMYKILRNRFISDVRKKRPNTDIDSLSEAVLAYHPPHEELLMLQDLLQAFNQLPDDQRQALVMSVMEGMSYEELAQNMSCAVGTAKSRVFRARRQLENRLLQGTETKGMQKGSVKKYGSKSTDCVCQSASSS